MDTMTKITDRLSQFPNGKFCMIVTIISIFGSINCVTNTIVPGVDDSPKINNDVRTDWIL